MDLDGAQILVTGASGGLGAAIAHGLAARGARPILSGRNESRLQVLAEAIGENHPRPEILIADWRSSAGRQALVARVTQPDNPVSAVILNAGVNRFGAYEEQTSAQVAEIIQTDLLAPALLAHGMLPSLKQRKASCLLFVGSSFGRLGHPGFAAYGAAKHGLHGLAKALRRECAGTGLTVAEVHPRAMQTEMTTADMVAVNRLQSVTVDQPAVIAAQVIKSLSLGRRHWQAGWPERLFILIDQRMPWLLDRVLGGRWPRLHRAAIDAAENTPSSPAANSTASNYAEELR